MHTRLRSLLLLVPLLAAAMLLLGWALPLYTSLLNYPYATDGLEGTLLAETRLWRSGEPIYAPLERYRFVSAPYPPLHYIFMMLPDLIAGPHVFWGARLVSLVAAAVVALCCAWLVARGSGSWLAALVAAALMLSAPPLILWGTRIKPDVLALMFTALGLVCAQWALGGFTTTPPRTHRPAEPPLPSRAERTLAGEPRYGTDIRRFPLLLAAVCFVAAFFTKQTAVAGALATGIALLAVAGRDWWVGRPRHAASVRDVATPTILFSAVYLALALGIWALLDLWTGRAYTLHVWWNFERGSWWSFGLFAKVVGLLGFWWPAMILAAACVVLSFRHRALFVPAAYVLVAPLTLLGSGETGAHHNHLLETHLALAVAAGCAIGVFTTKTQRAQSTATLASIVATALFAVQLWGAFTPPQDWYATQLRPDPEDTPERYLHFMRNTPGEILADDTGLLFQAGKPLRYNDPSTMGPAAAQGFWDPGGLIEEIRARRFSAIMIPTDVTRGERDETGRWTPEMLDAIREHYVVLYRDTIVTYVPGP